MSLHLLRIFEALCIYAAAHADGLPNNFSDIAEVPVPDDPITDKPFVYRRGGDSAYLDRPAFHSPLLNYKVSIAAAK